VSWNPGSRKFTHLLCCTFEPDLVRSRRSKSHETNQTGVAKNDWAPNPTLRREVAPYSLAVGNWLPALDCNTTVAPDARLNWGNLLSA
jgi:hypothetical protein